MSNEKQKPTTNAYRENWNLIFSKKKNETQFNPDSMIEDVFIPFKNKEEK